MHGVSGGPRAMTCGAATFPVRGRRKHTEGGGQVGAPQEGAGSHVQCFREKENKAGRVTLGADTRWTCPRRRWKEGAGMTWVRRGSEASREGSTRRRSNWRSPRDPKIRFVLLCTWCDIKACLFIRLTCQHFSYHVWVSFCRSL